MNIVGPGLGRGQPILKGRILSQTFKVGVFPQNISLLLCVPWVRFGAPFFFPARQWRVTKERRE